MYSIYHFFAHLVQNKSHFFELSALAEFPFDSELLSCKSDGKFPDMAVKINKGDTNYSGGELIELKDSKTYSVSSFNSTIPTGKKEIAKIVTGENSIIRGQMEASGDDVFSLPVRDVYYLIRGRRRGAVKVCLVHGSFFETVPVSELIRESFSQVLDELLQRQGIELTNDMKTQLLSIFSEQQSFSRVRNVEKASVKLRFRVMTEVKRQGNILNPRVYPEINDDTLNFVVPCHTSETEELTIEKLYDAMGLDEYNRLNTLKVRHLLNGDFLVFQTSLTS